jgi:hypothetical protein
MNDDSLQVIGLDKGAVVEGHDCGAEEHAVAPVGHSAVPRDERAKVLKGEFFYDVS